MTRDDFNKRDLTALDLAMALLLASGGEQSAVFRQTLREAGWAEAAMCAAHACQYENLQLSPWEASPSQLDSDDVDTIIAKGADANHEYGAAVLAKKMVAAGISLFHPQPIAALAAKQRV